MNSFDTITNLFGRYGNYAWTVRGSLISSVRIGGVNQSTLTQEDFSTMIFMLRNILITLPTYIVPTFYLVNRKGITVKAIEGVSHPIGRKIDEDRAKFLTDMDLSSCELFVTLECLPSISQFGRPSVPGLFYLFGSALVSAEGRKNLMSKLSNKEAVSYFSSTLSDMRDLLEQATNRLVSRLGLVMDAESQSVEQTYALCKFLATYDTRHLDECPDIPDQNWAKYLFDGEVDTVSTNGVPCLYIQGAEDRFVRFGSISGFTNPDLKPGMFAQGDEPPFDFNENFVYCQRFHPFTPLARAAFFKNKESEVSRQNLKVSDMLNATTDMEKKRFIRQSQKDRIAELDEAVNLPEQWGYTTCHFALFGDPESFGKRSNVLQARFEQSGASVVWESSSIRQVYSLMMPSMVDEPIRKQSLNTAQFAAIAPVFRDSQGQKHCTDIDKPALFTFTTRTKKPFYYSHWSGDVGVNIGIGPIGTGKTFTKNSISKHFSVWEGIHRSVDIDPGSEPLAELYGEDGGIFRLDPENAQSLNPFALLDGTNKDIYKIRLKTLIVSMLRFNDSEEGQKLSAEEEAAMGETIGRCVEGNSKFHHFTALVAMMPKSLQAKLSSFVDDGTYSGLFSAEKDSIGQVDQMYGVYNLQAIKQSPVMLQLAMGEIFFRTRLTSGMKQFADRVKYIEFDEAHHLLKNAKDVDEILAYARTSRKDFGGIGLWSQNAFEFDNIEAWPALRNAVSSFFFMADHTADEAVYRETFKLDNGQISAIQSLEPKKEALIVQPRIGVSQVVQLLVDDHAEAMITSQPQERAARWKFVEEYGWEEGIERTVEFMRERRAKITNVSA